MGLAGIVLTGGGRECGAHTFLQDIDYLSLKHLGSREEEEGDALAVEVLTHAADKSVTIVVVSSLTDVAKWLRNHEQLFVQKVQRVVIQGGVKEFTAGQAPPGRYLEPDSAHNNMFDAKASEFFYRRCQELGVPLVVLSRFTAYAAPMPRSVYDEMAATGSPPCRGQCLRGCKAHMAGQEPP